MQQLPMCLCKPVRDRQLQLKSSPQDLTKHIFKALAHTGQRAIIGKGWAKLGTIKNEPTPPHVLLVDSVPHDWLFTRCSAVIHHGAYGICCDIWFVGSVKHHARRLLFRKAADVDFVCFSSADSQLTMGSSVP